MTFTIVKTKKVRKYCERNQDKIPSTEGKRCFLCTRGIYHAVNGKGRDCPVCSSGKLPETKEYDYDRIEYWRHLCY